MSFEVLTKKEAAKRARISSRFLDVQIKAGMGPAITRIGRRSLVRSDELQEWLERCTVPQRDEAAA